MYSWPHMLQRHVIVHPSPLLGNVQWHQFVSRLNRDPVCNKTKFSSSSTPASVEEKLRLKKCFSILGVTEDASITELKDVYISLAKQYHPDSGLDNADAVKFQQVKEAYKVILDHHKCKELVDAQEEVDQMIFDIKHTAPQHRQFLSFEGIGFGTQSQREKQYQQYKVSRAAENILEHRMQQLAMETEDALLVKDKQATKRTKISNAIERIVEDLIQDAMNKGHFENLAGAGKPINNFDRNPYVDTTTHNLNKILINNGYAPEWIRLQGEIRTETSKARERLAVLKKKLGTPPFSTADGVKWNSAVKSFQVAMMEVNEKIIKYNFIVPFLDKQLICYDIDKQLLKVCEDCENYLPADVESLYTEHYGYPAHQINYQASKDKIQWLEVWKNIKEVFRS